MSVPLDSGGRNFGDIFEFKSMTIDGKPVVDGEVIKIEEGTVVAVEYSWNTEGLNAQPGDTASIRLSDAFLSVDIEGVPITVEDVPVGTYSIKDGYLTFVFTENITQDNVQNGWVLLYLEFDLEKFKENVVQEIPFYESSGKNITVVAKPDAEIADIEKEGHANAETDATYITWTVDVINNTDKKITGAKVTDVLPEGLGSPRNFVIKKLQIGLDGDRKARETVFSEKQSFDIELGTMDSYTGYRIEYITDIEDYTKKSFSNSAVFTYDSKEGGLPAVGTVSNIQRSSPIEKNGEQNGKTAEGKDLISWWIDVNKNGQPLPKTIVADNLPMGLEIVPGSIQVVKIEKSGNNWVEGDPHAVTFAEFPIALGDLAKNEAYRIKFYTTVDWKKVNNGDYQRSNGFKNVATLYHTEVKEENEVNKDDKTVTINRAPILKKVGVQNVDYNNKTITWTVAINEAGHPLDDVIVTDILPKGLQLTTGSGINGSSIVIKDVTSTPHENFPVDSGNVTVKDLTGDDAGKTEIEIILEDVGTKTITITYTTEITDFSINSFINEVGMNGDGIGTDFGSNDNQRKVEIKPNSNFYEKKFAGVDYENKTISWTLTVDPIREGIQSGFVVTDTFPNAGLILLENSVVVKLGDDTLDKDSDHYNLVPISPDYGHGFTITINQSIKGQKLVVTYDTSYDPDVITVPHNNSGEKELYKNKTVFAGKTESGVDINQKRNAEHQVRTDSWNSGKKEGSLYHIDDSGNAVNGWTSGFERRIAWQVYINYHKQNLGENVVVTDTLAYDGIIDPESIKVSEYTVSSNGDTTITDNELDKSKYKVDTTTKSSLTVDFTDFEVKERYVIEFTTTVPDMSLGTYTNDAVVDVNGTEYTYEKSIDYDEYNVFLDKESIGVEGERAFTGDEVNWKVTVNKSLSIIHEAEINDTISSGHVYKNGSLKIYPLQDDKNPLVENADYKLIVGENVLTITLLGNEPLKDTLVLEYVTVVTTISGQIGNKVEIKGKELTTVEKESDKLNARLFSDVGGEWAKDKGALRVTKIDSETDEIITNEATFTLWYELNGEKEQYTQEDPFTTENGILEIGNLPLRTYYLREVAAPTGYVISSEELEIVVDTVVGNNKDYPIVKEVEFENTKEKTEITATKVWNGGSSSRPTVWFKLYRQIPGGDLEEVPVNQAEIKVLESGTTEVTWEDVDKANMDGVEYIYSVKEVNSDGTDFTPENYIKAENSLSVTNYYVSPTDASAKAVKVWDGEPEGRSVDRPTVWFKLYRYVEDGDVEEVPEAEADIKELADGTTEVVWTGLTKTDGDGKEYSFLVKEVDSDGNDFVPENYEKSEEALTVTNTYTKKDVTATKVWIGGSSPRPTIWFELYRQIEGGELEKADAEIIELADGTEEVIWEDLDKTDENGNEYTYSVKEVDEEGNDFVPNGYSKSEEGLTVTNTRRTTGGPDPVYGKIAIKKTDEDKKVLPGAEFTLYDEDGKVVDRGVTGSDGTLSFEDLEPGSYTLKETKAPEGYVLEVDEKGVTVAANRTNTYTFTNKKAEPEKPGRIEIVKVDEEGRLLSEAWFSLIDGNGTTIENVVTVNGRAAFEDVPVGRYTVKEVQAPEGYVLTEQEVNVTVDSEETVTVRFVNKQSGTTVVPVSGRITINKVDENNMALAGAEFTLYNENNEIVGTAVSEASGRVIFENLKDGRYFVRETEAPAGYRLVSDSLTVNVTGGSSYSYRFRNVPDTEDIDDPEIPLGWEEIDDPDVPRDVLELPDTGSLLNTWLMITIGLMLIFAGMFLFRTKLTNN